jgi:hypothetical protein
VNHINYVVRYNFKVPITQINVTDFMVRMNNYFNVAAYSPYASVHVYSVRRPGHTRAHAHTSHTYHLTPRCVRHACVQVQRQFTCCSWIDWYINTSFGPSLMAQGLGLSEETIANATGMPTNNLPGQIWGWTKDT